MPSACKFDGGWKVFATSDTSPRGTGFMDISNGAGSDLSVPSGHDAFARSAIVMSASGGPAKQLARQKTARQ